LEPIAEEPFIEELEDDNHPNDSIISFQHFLQDDTSAEQEDISESHPSHGGDSSKDSSEMMTMILIWNLTRMMSTLKGYGRAFRLLVGKSPDLSK
jgi:hypothetical protein